MHVSRGFDRPQGEGGVFFFFFSFCAIELSHGTCIATMICWGFERVAGQPIVQPGRLICETTDGAAIHRRKMRRRLFGLSHDIWI